MAKTLRDYVGYWDGNKQEKFAHRDYFLEDVFEEDPRRFCPNCHSNQTNSLHTHNVDGYDYKCDQCESTYSLMLFTRKEEVG
jgi:hypothetical protein